MAVRERIRCIRDRGRAPARGRVRAAGNKNGALPILAACLLTEEAVVLHDVPRILDVLTMIDLLIDLGAEVEWIGAERRARRTRRNHEAELDEELCKLIRASVLLAGPLLARFGSAIVPPPGGDVIGRRRVDTHIHAFERSAPRSSANRRYELTADGLARRAHLPRRGERDRRPRTRSWRRPSRKGETILGNAACEPHVQDLCRFLVALGAQIEGIGTNVLRIQGVDALHGGETRSAPTTSRSRASSAWRDDRGRDHDRGRRRDDLVAVMPVFARLGVKMESSGDRDPRARRPGARDHRRHRRCDPEDRRRAVAGVPGRPHVDRRRRRDAGARHGDDLREDVREPAVLRRQARRRSARGSSSAIRIASSSPVPRRCTASGWRAPTSVPAWRCCSRRSAPRAHRRSATCARSTAATSGSTNGFARSARRSSASRAERLPGDRHRQRRRCRHRHTGCVERLDGERIGVTAGDRQGRTRLRPGEQRRRGLESLLSESA